MKTIASAVATQLAVAMACLWISGCHQPPITTLGAQSMDADTTALVARFLSAENSDQERESALRLVEHLRENNETFDVVFKEINKTEDLSNEAYLVRERGIVVVTIAGTVIVWDPIDRVNTDMFFTE